MQLPLRPMKFPALYVMPYDDDARRIFGFRPDLSLYKDAAYLLLVATHSTSIFLIETKKLQLFLQIVFSLGLYSLLGGIRSVNIIEQLN